MIRLCKKDIDPTIFDSVTHAAGCEAHENLRGKLVNFFNPKNLEFIDTIKVRAGGFRPQNIGFMSQATLFLWLIKFSKNLIPSNSWWQFTSAPDSLRRFPISTYGAYVELPRILSRSIFNIFNFWNLLPPELKFAENRRISSFKAPYFDFDTPIPQWPRVVHRNRYIKVLHFPAISTCT
jgi:hypothetical protein